MIKYLKRVGVKSDYAYAAAVGSIGLSWVVHLANWAKSDKAQADRWGIFIGTWAPTMFGLGIALRLEEQTEEQHEDETESTPG
jgi:hypothetical protein